MECILNAVTAALRRAEIDCAAAIPPGSFPRLDAPVAAVNLRQLAISEAGLGRYLGLDAEGNEVFGRRASATVAVTIYGPKSAGSAPVTALCERVVWALDEGVSHLSDGAITLSEPGYDEATDCLRQQVVCELGGIVLSTVDIDGSIVTDFTLKGTIS